MRLIGDPKWFTATLKKISAHTSDPKSQVPNLTNSFFSVLTDGFLLLD